MTTIPPSVAPMTAAAFMTREVVTVPQRLPAIDAVRILLEKSIGALPVVDDDGRCVGIFSNADMARVAHSYTEQHQPPVPCPFQLRHRSVTGQDVTLCTLEHEHCLLQRTITEEGRPRNICSYPHEIIVDWTMLQPEIKPTDPIQKWMTVEPITVPATATVAECAARMLQAKIHRLIVLDDSRHVVGILSSTDILKAISTGSHLLEKAHA